MQGIEHARGAPPLTARGGRKESRLSRESIGLLFLEQNGLLFLVTEQIGLLGYVKVWLGWT